MEYSSFYHSCNPSSSLLMFYSKHEEWMAYSDPLVWILSNCNMPSSQSQWFFLRVRKNYITADISEPFRIILTLVIHSYRNTNLLGEKKRSLLSSSLTLDTVYQSHLKLRDMPHPLDVSGRWWVEWYTVVRYSYNIDSYTTHQTPLIGYDKWSSQAFEKVLLLYTSYCKEFKFIFKSRHDKKNECYFRIQRK